MANIPRVVRRTFPGPPWGRGGGRGRGTYGHVRDQFRNQRDHLEDPVRRREMREDARCREDLARCREDLARWQTCREELESDRRKLDTYNEELRCRGEHLEHRERKVKEEEEALSRKRKRVEQYSILANNVLVGLCKYKGEPANDEKERLEKFDIVQLGNERFIINAKIGGGKDGWVYSAMFIPGTKQVAVQGRLLHINVDSEMGFHPHEEVAIKYFKKDVRMHQNEIRINKNLTGVEGIPKSWWIKDKDSGALLMENAGCNLYDKFLAKGAELPGLEYVHKLGVQLLEVLRGMHDKNILHMDLKPANIALKGDKLYIIDFGESLNLEGKSIAFTGRKYTSIYGSSNMNSGREICKIDDLWSAYYILYELVHGQLVWRVARDRARDQAAKKKIEHEAMVKSKKTFQPSCVIFEILKDKDTTYDTKFERFKKSLEDGQGLL